LVSLKCYAVGTKRVATSRGAVTSFKEGKYSKLQVIWGDVLKYFIFTGLHSVWQCRRRINVVREVGEDVNVLGLVVGLGGP
jgi:hypothetical protein